MKSLLFKRIFQARKKRIMVYNKIRKVWAVTGPFVCHIFPPICRPAASFATSKAD